MRAGRAGGRWVAAAVVVALGLAVSGCGLLGDDDDDAGPDSTEHDQDAGTEALTVPGDLDGDAGCGDEAVTDPADLAADRSVARCAPEAPAAAPLAAPATVRVGVRATTEDLAPVLLAQQVGEFAAENLTVEIHEYGDARELFEALGADELDLVVGDLDGPFFDGVADHSGARIVLGGAVAPAAHDTDTAQTGLWMRTDLAGEDDGWLNLEKVGLPIAVEDSIGDVAVLPVDFVLQQDDISLNELEVVTISGREAVEQLLDGGLSGAWLTDPHWRDVPGSDLPIELVATLPVAESLGGVVMASHLLDADRDRAVGLGFTRAVIRTINTYLADDYQDDDEVVEALAEVTGESEEDIVGTPAWVFDWEIRSNTTKRIQAALIMLGGITYEEEIAERLLVDRSLYEEAVTSSGG